MLRAFKQGSRGGGGGGITSPELTLANHDSMQPWTGFLTRNSHLCTFGYDAAGGNNAWAFELGEGRYRVCIDLKLRESGNERYGASKQTYFQNTDRI